MSNVKADIKIVEDTFSVKADEILRVMPNAVNSGLRAAARLLYTATRKILRSKFPNSTKRNPLYNDTLYDGVKMKKPHNGEIAVHVMGTKKKGSGTFRLRFFEGGTADRYQTKIKGKTLKKKRYIGKIEALRFFEAANGQISQSVVNSKMDEQIEKYLNKKWAQN
jgi:hypothetical protein